MDRLLYISMSGASETFYGQSLHANNLANVSTPGFRTQLEQQRSMPVYGDGFPSRVFAGSEVPGNDFTPSGSQITNNPLDMAIAGEGWFAVQNQNGEEAYTRRGDVKVSIDGTLVNGAGHFMMGAGGPIILPPYQDVTIADDGVISFTPLGSESSVRVVLDRLKLVNPDINELELKTDGLFHLKSGGAADLDPGVRIQSGSLEMSNVNAVGELMDIIALARKHELDVKMMKAAEDNDKASARILQLNG